MIFEELWFSPPGKIWWKSQFYKMRHYGFPKKNSGGPMAYNVQNSLLNDTQSSKVRLKMYKIFLGVHLSKLAIDNSESEEGQGYY